MIPSLLSDSVSGDFGRSLDYALLWGFEEVVIRTVDHALVPEVNVPKMQRKLTDNDLKVSAIVPELFRCDMSDRASWSNDLIALRDVVVFANKVSCDLVLVPCPESDNLDVWIKEGLHIFQKAGDVAAAHNVRIAIKHEDIGVKSNLDNLKLLIDRLGHPSVGIVWSPSVGIQNETADRWNCPVPSDNLFGVTVRDARWRDGERLECELGEGEVDWDQILFGLAGSTFDGPLILDVRMRPPRRTGLRASTKLLKMVRSVEHGRLKTEG